ncbi:MAG: cobalt ECF transporter T component CbiQ [Planctomycetota bacterium]|nr:cobalt ECF transporter T component CbiQ [Planctomycetota bacterium]MDA1214106.1 cobalt ECF transporter T component CbiQ [Planctomycetota bacterium]
MAGNYWDRYAREMSVCHRLPTGLKLSLTLTVILLGCLIPVEHWPVHILLLSLVFAGQSLAGISVSYLVKRLSLFLPMISILSLSLPLSHGGSAGWIIAASIFLRGALAFMAMLWLVNVTTTDQMLETMRRYGMPAIVVATLAFMYRYLFLAWDERDRMLQARRARTFGTPTVRQRWQLGTQLIGMLLIRSMSRAERIYGAMCARGWNGTVHHWDSPVTAETVGRIQRKAG